MKIITLALSIILGIFSQATHQQKSDRDKAGLRGAVKTVRTEMLYFDKDGRPREEGRHLNHFTAYNEDGNTLEDEPFYAYGKASYGKRIFKYDSTGRKVEDVHQLGLSTKTVTNYDEQGRISKITEGIWIETFFYDAEDRVKEVHRANSDGQLFHKRVHTYPLNGRIDEESIYDPEGNLETKYVTVYDDKGRVICRENGEPCKGCYYNKDITTYDEKGNEIEFMNFNAEGLRERAVYGYEYDSTGNWIKQFLTRWHVRDGKSSAEIYRIITYY